MDGPCHDFWWRSENFLISIIVNGTHPLQGQLPLGLSKAAECCCLACPEMTSEPGSQEPRSSVGWPKRSWWLWWLRGHPGVKVKGQTSGQGQRSGRGDPWPRPDLWPWPPDDPATTTTTRTVLVTLHYSQDSHPFPISAHFSKATVQFQGLGLDHNRLSWLCNFPKTVLFSL